jgi:hypothetical protein
MLRTGLTAAGLALAAVVLVAGGRAEPAHTGTTHRCGAQDRQFVHAAQLGSSELSIAGDDYQSGALTAKEAIAETRDAQIALVNTSPLDPSLKLTKALMRGMMQEYQRALRAQSKGTADAGLHMYRSYSLANYAHQTLVDAQPALDKLGCDVGPLLQE